LGGPTKDKAVKKSRDLSEYGVGFKKAG